MSIWKRQFIATYRTGCMNPMECYNEQEFRRRYRFSKETAQLIVERLHPYLQNTTFMFTHPFAPLFLTFLSLCFFLSSLPAYKAILLIPFAHISSLSYRLPPRCYLSAPILILVKIYYRVPSPTHPTPFPLPFLLFPS